MRAVTKAWRAHQKAEKAKAKADPDLEAKHNGANGKKVDEYPLARISTVGPSLLNQPLPPTPRHSGVTPTNKAGELVVDDGHVLNTGVPRQSGESRSRLLEPSSPEARMAMDLVPRPTHRLGWIPFVGQQVDTFDWCKVCLVFCSHQVVCLTCS